MAVSHFTMDREAVRRFLKVKLSTDRRVFGKAKTMAGEAFDSWHEALLQEFDEHPVTIELQTAASGDADSVPNLSGTTGGFGNLYGYLGFWADEDPTEPLRQLLRGIRLDYRGLTANNDFHFAYKIPTIWAIHKASMLTAWGAGGGSWVDVVEKGNGGLGGGSEITHFIPKPFGRSGGGVQIKPTYNAEAEFHSTPYITAILEKFSQSPAGQRGVSRTWSRGQQ